MNHRAAILPTLAFLLLAPAAADAAPASHPPRHLAPCTVSGDGGHEAQALCGTYRVWENRTAKSGRKIGLKVVVLPAETPHPKPDPIFFLAGGPGEAATTVAGGVAGGPVRRDRDFVFVDQRGTGEPDPLGCELGGHEDDLQSYLGEMFPVAAVEHCRDELAKSHDLTLYTTDLAMDDFDEVRSWLGYGKIDLFGGSYGTRAAQVYLRRHPRSVRAVILEGVVPMDEALPISHAAGGQRSLDLLLGWCEKDAACNAAFPDIRRELATVLDRLAHEPATVKLRNPRTGKAEDVRLSREIVAEGIRWLLYNTGTGARLPLLVHEAAAGDLAPLGQASVDSRVGIIHALAMGMFFSVTCSEDIPFIDPAQIGARTAGSFLGEYRVRQQMAACAVWPHARIEPSHREAIHSDVPVLLISGERDPVTPPDFALRATRFLTHAVQVVVPYGAHGSEDPCIEQIERSFIDKGAGEGLDTSCVSRIRLTPFVLEKPKG